MKTLICTLNSKYIHSCLAPWNLLSACKAYCGGDVVLKVLEGTVNENQNTLLERILSEKADIISFSCYIWNIEKVLSFCEKIKLAKPGTVIVLGGPEVAYRQKDILEGFDFVDYVLSGEGEITLPGLLDCLSADASPKGVAGVSFCENGELIVKNEAIGESSLCLP